MHLQKQYRRCVSQFSDAKRYALRIGNADGLTNPADADLFVHKSASIKEISTGSHLLIGISGLCLTLAMAALHAIWVSFHDHHPFNTLKCP